MTSLWEGLPRSLVEALSLGVPSVCYETDGVKDLLSLGGGILIPPKNLQYMAEKLNKLLRDPTIIDFPQTLKTKIDTEFEIHEMVRKQEHLYEKLLKTV